MIFVRRGRASATPPQDIYDLSAVGGGHYKSKAFVRAYMFISNYPQHVYNVFSFPLYIQRCRTARYILQVPEWKNSMRSGATGPIEAAMLKGSKHFFGLVPQQIREPMVGPLLSALTKLVEHVGDDAFRGQIADQSMQHQLMASKSALAVHLGEFPVDPSLKLCEKLGILLLNGENLESVDSGLMRNTFDVTVDFMVDECWAWSCSEAGEHEKLWAMHIHAVMKGLVQSADDRVWSHAVGVVADLQRSAVHLSGPSSARDCARQMLCVKNIVKGGLALEDDKRRCKAEQWCLHVLNLMKKIDDVISGMVLSDLQVVADVAVEKAAKLKEVCRGGASGKHWAENKKSEVDIVQHARGAFLKLTGLTQQIEKANAEATEADVLEL